MGRTARRATRGLAGNDPAQPTQTKEDDRREEGEDIVMRRKTRPTAKYLTVAVACVALVVGLVGLGFGLT